MSGSVRHHNILRCWNLCIAPVLHVGALICHATDAAYFHAKGCPSRVRSSLQSNSEDPGSWHEATADVAPCLAHSSHCADVISPEVPDLVDKHLQNRRRACQGYRATQSKPKRARRMSVVMTITISNCCVFYMYYY